MSAFACGNSLGFVSESVSLAVVCGSILSILVRHTLFLSFPQAAFNCIRSLWNRKPLKVYGGRMAESMLAILCHILRGEPVIQERLAKEREGTVRPDEEGASTAPVAPTGAPGAAVTAVEGSAPAVPASVAPAGGSADDSTNSTPRREPQVNQAQLTQVRGSSCLECLLAI